MFLLILVWQIETAIRMNEFDHYNRQIDIKYN